MSDRLQEIRARLDAATPGPWAVMYRGTPHCVVVKSREPDPDPGLSWWVMAWPRWRKRDALAQPAMDNNADLIAHAPADIAWLLGRLDFETRLVADLEAQLDRAHERYAAEIERLRNTNLSVSQPLCDGAADA